MQQKLLNAKFPARNVLKWQIVTDFTAKLWGLIKLYNRQLMYIS